MYPHSGRWDTEICRSGRQTAAGVTLLDSGIELPAKDLGALVDDAQAAVRRTLSLTIGSTGDYLPLDVHSALFPGTAVQPWQELRYPDGGLERIPLGVLLVADPTVEETGPASASISVQLEDRAAAVSLAPLPSALPIPAGASLAGVLTDLLTTQIPGCPPVRLASADVTIAADTFLPAGGDLWSHLTSESTDEPGLVVSAGRRLWFDADGYPALYGRGAVTSPRVIDSGAVVSSKSTAILASEAYGGVVVTSNVFGDDDPLSVVLYDPSPPSPLFAKRLYFQAMDDIDNTDDLQIAAAGLLAEKTAIKGRATWTMPPDPTIQSGDLLKMEGEALQGLFEVARVEIPPRGLMTVTALDRVIA